MRGAGALLAAVKAGDTDTVARLLARDPRLAGAQEAGISAVRLARYHRQPAVLDVTEERRAALAAAPGGAPRRSADGFTALHYACFFGGAPAVGVLLAA